MKIKINKDRLITVLLIFCLLAGLSVMLYPTISEYHNSLTQTKAIAEYSDIVAQLEEEQYDRVFASSEEYNKNLKRWSAPYQLTQSEQEDYESQLNLSGTGVMGYVEVPSINCSLPIYHGTDEAVLQVAVGHLEWSSLPVGGKSTHCVISGHRGLPSANLFSDLDKVEIGDTFLLRVLDEVFTYEVDQILTVEPEDTTALRITEGEDYCTLVTCTPYGINSHRLLVRGHRVPNTEESELVAVTADATRLDTLMVVAVVAIALAALFLIIFLLMGKPKTAQGTSSNGDKGKNTKKQKLKKDKKRKNKRNTD